MEPIDYLVAVWRHRFVIIVLTVLGLGTGLLVASLTTPTYQAGSSVLLTPSPGVTNDELGQVGNYMNYQIHSYAELARSRVVLDPAVEDADLPYGADVLAEQVSAQVPVNTSVININVTETDPARAARVANAVAENLVTAVKDAAPEPSEDQTTLELRTVARALTPQDPVAPQVPLYMAGGAALGFFLGALIALARFALLRSRRTAEAAELAAGAPRQTWSAARADRAAERETEAVRS
jgi:succinoglycan biosynthesis transport protein ExoP